MSPMLATRLTNLTNDLERALSRIAEYDRSESEMDDMTLGDIKLAFEGLRLKIAEADRVVANFRATVSENWE